uniref:Uncharacterized protein n=1 Tax=Romanomermis culicivorax TaxID=13658 RepID=A0A915II92_ROMCU
MGAGGGAMGAGGGAMGAGGGGRGGGGGGGGGAKKHLPPPEQQVKPDDKSMKLDFLLPCLLIRNWWLNDGKSVAKTNRKTTAFGSPFIFVDGKMFRRNCKR